MIVKEIAICFEDEVDISDRLELELSCAIDEVLSKHGLEKECLLYA